MRSDSPLSRTRSRAERGLLLGDRDADAAHAVLAGRVQQQRAPAAADVQQPLALAQLELAADQVDLARLRGVERVVVPRVVGA